MTDDEPQQPLELVPLALFGLFLLGIVVLTPDIGHARGLDLFHAVRQSSWTQFGDWPLAWCSCKLIFAAVGSFMLAHVVCACLSRWLTPLANWLIVPAIVAAGGVFWFGFFYLVKALL
jgi:hypothetical protein